MQYSGLPIELSLLNYFYDVFVFSLQALNDLRKEISEELKSLATLEEK
jgi:hypothetical protein